MALVVAAVHLYWGIPRFVAYASIGAMPDPRPLAFVLSGHAILIALTLIVLGVLDRRRTYLPGMVLMAAHLVGYVAWHTLLAHGVPTAYGPVGHGHPYHDVQEATLVVVEHVLNSPLALVSKLAELGLLVLLIWFWSEERRGRAQA